MELSPKGSIYKPYHTLRLWELCSKGKQKDCKSQEITEIVVRLCLIVKSEVPSIKALTQLPKHELNKVIAINIPKWM